MIKSIPSTDEMRVLIKNIFETSSKLNGTIQINSLDDAATFAAYLYGFSSWKEYQNIHKAEYEDKPREEFTIKLPKFKNKNYKKNDYFLNSFNPLVLPKESELKIANVIPLEWLMGKKRNIIAKIDEPIGLLSDDYIVTGSPIESAYKVFENKINWLLKYQQSFIIFGLDNPKILHILKEKKTTFVGKNNIKIDPIEESFENEGFETLLGVKPFGESYHFPWIWAMMVRTLREEMKLKWTSKKLLESLTLEYLLEITDRIKTINPLVAKPLHQYLYKQCGVGIDNNEYIISEEAQSKHYHQIYLIKEKLEKIDKLYELGYFSENAKFSIKNAIFEKQSLVFSQCDDEKLKTMYWDACNICYLNGMKKQNKEIKNLDNKQYRIWSLWWFAENIISEDIGQEILENKESSILGLYILSSNNKLEIFFNSIQQILFLKQYFSTYPLSWIKLALNKTIYWEENIWFENFQALKNLGSNEAFLWKIHNTLVPPGIEDFELKKIELYSSDPLINE